LRQLGITFSGELDAAGEALVGTFQQGFSKLPLTLSRVSDNPYLERPQTPQPPYPYEETEVTFSNGDLTFAGTLTMPKDAKKLTAVVLVSGSGAQNRDEEVMGHKPFKVIADYLSRNGVAVLRYDDRGVGGSSQGTAHDTTDDFATNALAAVKFLKSVPQINKKKIGVIGHSEGGIIAIMLAAKHSKDIAFIGTIAGPVMKGADLMLLQNEEVVKLSGSAMSDADRQYTKNIFAAIDTISDTERLRTTLKDMMAKNAKTPAQVMAIESQVAAMTSAWYRRFVQYAPVDDLKRVKCPMMAIFGWNDVQVPAVPNEFLLKQNYRGKNLETIIYPSHNHFMQHCSGPTLDYGIIEQTIDPKVLGDMLQWVKKR
jgi:pimeloyl-ACP methyl ester carboxylesterase